MAPSEEQGIDGIGKLAAVDEILQVMFWLRGEHLAVDVNAAELVRWIGLDHEQIGPLLERLADSGLVQQVEPLAADGAARYALTISGVREGGRRFMDEFADLTRPGHYECNDPDCECQRTGNPADCGHRTCEGSNP